MKKRIISLLLTVLMVMSLFSGLSVNAYAAQYNGANVIEYTMSQGDFVLRICQRLGLNYYTCKDAIQILNNIQDGQWNKLTVGTNLLLPASDYDAVLIANGAGTTARNTGAAATTATTSNVIGTATTGTTATTATNAAASSADVLGYYIVPYTLSYGETVSGVCNSLGVNFSIFGGFIKQLNNVSNWNKVRAGDTIVIPTPYAPSVGTTCYGVMEHIVTNSDTAYGIVTSKGLNYNANERVLKVLNQTDNLAAVNAGQKFFYAVPLTVNVPGTGNPGSTTTTTTTTTVTDGNGTTTTQTTTTAKLYKLSSGMSASDGTMLFYVGSQPVTAAAAGAKVTVVTSTNSGKAIQNLTVKHADGKADLHLSGDTFVMPSCDVRVEAVVKTGHDINISANYSGKAVASVGGISVQSAVKGATVIIKSADPNYEITAVYASYKKLISASTKTPITVSSSNAFIMPDADADVEVVLRPVSTYSFYVNDPPFGTFYLQVNGSPVTRAAKGAEVTIVANPEEGFVPGVVMVTKHGDATKFVNFFNNTFTMPGYDVDVNVTFVAKGNNVIIMPAQGGSAAAYASTGGLVQPTGVDTSEVIDEAGSGDFVLLDATPDDTTVYQLDPNDPYEIVRISDGLKVNVGGPVTLGGIEYYYFRMPKGGVTVTPHFTGITASDIISMIYRNGTSVGNQYQDCSFSVTTNGSRAEFTTSGQLASDAARLGATVANGRNIDLRSDCADGIAFVRYSIQIGTIAEGRFTASTVAADVQLAEELTNEANLYGYFEMPDQAICISAYFESGKVPIGPAAIIEGNGTVSYMVRPAFDMPMDFSDIPGAILATLGTSVNSAEPGDTVFVLAAPANGYTFDNTRFNDKLKVTRRDNGAPLALTPVGPVMDTRSGGIWAYQYSFVMPAVGVDVTCAFDARPFRLYMKCVDETGKDISGLGLWQIAVNMEPGIVDNSMFAEAIGTVVNVAYGDYVTVAMTEAGWSKYDMVSFRIDGKEYTADSLNHFYNFQMIDERAKDLEIVAVMRPRVPYSVGIHNLYATYVDTTKGAAQFVILDSPTGYSDQYRTNRFNVPNYVNKAVYGDKVGVIVSSISNNYRVEAKDITLYSLGTDADRIILKEEWVDVNGNIVDAGTAGAYRVFTFTMPDSDVYISVNFAGTKNALAITVRDDKTNVPVRNAVQVITNNANNPVTYDVGTDFTFDDVPYNTQVSVLRSTQALAESKVITRVDIANATGKSIPYTSLAAAGEGITFTMPNEPVWVIVYVSDRSFDLPLNVVNQVTNGSYVFRKSANPNDPTYAIESFAAGDVVYVHTTPNSGYDQLEAGEFAVLSNGVTDIATYVDDGIWSFTMPDGGTLIFKGDFLSKEAAERTIKILLVDGSGNEVADGKIKASASGSTASYGNGSTINVLEGQAVNFANDTASIVRVVSKSGKGLNGNTYTVPTGLTAASGIWDELTFTVNTKANKTSEITIKSPDGNVTIASTAMSGSFSKGDEKTFTLDVGSTITISSATAGLDKVTLTSASGRGVSGNKYTVPDVASDTLTINLSSSGNPIKPSVGANGEVQFFVDSTTTPLTTYSAGTGKTVVIKPTPNSGYEVNAVKVTQIVGNTAITPTKNADGTYSFEMPAGGVNVEVTFKASAVKITVRVVDKKDINAADITKVSSITGQKVKITVNGNEISYEDGQIIDTATAKQLTISGKTTSYNVDSVKVFKGSDVKTGTNLTSTIYTVAGGEKYLVFYVDKGTSATSGTSTGGSGTTGGVAKFDSAYDGGSEVANEGGEDLEQQNVNQDAEGSGTTDGDEVNLEYPKIEDTQNAEGGENVEGAQGAEGGENVEGAQGAEGGENVEGAQGAEGGSADGE